MELASFTSFVRLVKLVSLMKVKLLSSLRLLDT